VRQQNGEWIWPIAPFMNVMNLDATYLRREMRELVEFGFLFAPFEGMLPEVQQFSEIGRVRPSAPIPACRVNRCSCSN
jgi:hypothetical protein